MSPLSINPRCPASAQPTGPVIYYKDPNGRPFYSLTPRKTDDGKPYVAVLASEDVSVDPKPAAEAQAGRKIIYYRNPMGLPDISPVPKKDSMGMDYIPVYEGDQDDGNTVKVSAGQAAAQRREDRAGRHAADLANHQGAGRRRLR